MTPPIHCSPLSLLTFSLIKNTNSLQWNKIKPNCSFNSFTQKKKKKQISLLHFFTSREKFKFSSIEINIHKLVCENEKIIESRLLYNFVKKENFETEITISIANDPIVVLIKYIRKGQSNFAHLDGRRFDVE